MVLLCYLISNRPTVKILLLHSHLTLKHILVYFACFFIPVDYYKNVVTSNNFSLFLLPGNRCFRTFLYSYFFSVVLMTLYMGGYLLSTNKLTAGEVMAFLMASQTIQRSLAQVSLLFGSVVRGAAAGARIFEVMLNSFCFGVVFRYFYYI